MKETGGLRRNRALWTRIAGYRSRAPRLPEVRPPHTHVVVLDGTMSSLKPGCETNIGLTYRLLSDLPHDAHLTLYYEPGIQWRGVRRAHEVIAGVGINRQIRRAYLFLARNFQHGDRVVLMGYSRGAYAVRSLAGLIDLDRGCVHQPADPPRLPVSGAQFPARGPGGPGGLFARGLCGAVAGRPDRPDGPLARGTDRRADARPGLRPLPRSARKPAGSGAEGRALPCPCRDRVPRGLRHGPRAGHPMARPLALRTHAAPLPFPRAGPVDPRRATCAGARRNAGSLFAPALGRGARACGQRRGAADVVSGRPWRCRRAA